MPKNATPQKSSSKSTLSFRISEVSKMLSVSSSTLRQWENAGLTLPTRTKSGYRTYIREEVERLKSIQHLRFEKNLNVDAIRHLLGSGARGASTNGGGRSANGANVV